VLAEDECRCLTCGHPSDRSAIAAPGSSYRQSLIAALHQVEAIKTTLHDALRRLQ